ncbi:MAG: hypothetical protein ACOYMF_10085 [Bacteroidales bacterium]
MKRKLRIILIAILLVSTPILMMAQVPPHPNGGSNPGGLNEPVGGGAPIGGGLCILLAMGVAYGASKFYKERNSDSIKE